MTCERCEGLMREGPLMIEVEPFPQQWLATYHCMICKRIEYGTTPAEAVLKADVGLAA